MSNIKDIITTLTKTYKCEILRNKSLNIYHDIDIFCKEDIIPDIQKFLIQHHFTYTYSNYVHKFYTFVDSKIILLDIVTGTKHLELYFPIKSIKNEIGQ